MKIYGHFFSAPANQVRLTASALGVDHDYQHVDLQQGEQKSPEYLAINPYGKVPALDDDGFRLAESNAISRYLACKANCDLYPSDVKQRATIDQWMDYSAHHVRGNMAKILFNKVLAPMIGAEPDERSMKEGEEFLNNAMQVVDSKLGENAYIAGDNLSIADTALMAAMEPFEMIGYDVSKYENVATWRQKNMESDWYKNVHDHYAAEMQG